MPARRTLLGLAVLVVIGAAAVVGFAALSGHSPAPSATSAGSPATTPPARSGATSPSAVAGASQHPAPTQPGRTALPTGSAAAQLCADSTSNFGVAQTYLGLAESGDPQAAQACVFDNRVPLSVAEQLGRKVFLPTTTDARATVIDFRATDGTRVTVATVRKPDGRYYVTGVTVR